jgi:MFS-type transporter involved in bile tolerance (Atg22 family)
MSMFKDLMRILALVLIARAVYTDSVACAISAGTLYLGGFDTTFHLRQLFRNNNEIVKSKVSLEIDNSSSNVIKFNR